MNQTGGLPPGGARGPHDESSLIQGDSDGALLVGARDRHAEPDAELEGRLGRVAVAVVATGARHRKTGSVAAKSRGSWRADP